MKNTRKLKKGQIRMINNGNPKEHGQLYMIIGVVNHAELKVYNLTTKLVEFWDLHEEDLHMDIVVM